MIPDNIELPNKPLFRPDEVGKLIGVHPDTVRRWIREEKIETIKTLGGHNRIPRGEVERILEGKVKHEISLL